MWLRVLSYKGLYCVFSLLFLLLPLINRVSVTIFVLGLPIRTTVITQPDGLGRLVTVASFIFMAWAYIVMGNLWLSMAAKLGNDRLARFAGSWFRPLFSLVLAILPMLSGMSFLASNGLAEQLIKGASSLLPIGLLAASYLLLSAAIMYVSLPLSSKKQNNQR
jgi:hypothetical protein